MTTLPEELKLAIPPTLPQARSYLFSIPSLDATYDLFSNSQDIQIDIPRLQRSYLSKDSYLGFRVTASWIPGEIVGATTTAECSLCFDTAGAFGLFDAIEVYDYMGSTLIERINNQAELMSLLIDADPNAFGHPTANGTLPFISKSTVNPPYSQYNPSIVGPQSGEVFPSVPSTTAVTVSKDFAIPLASFLGFLSSKMAPLHNGYTLILKWRNPNLAFGVTPLGTDTSQATLESSLKSVVISNVNFHAQILELGPVAEGLLQASTNGEPMVIHTRAYRNYSTTWSSSDVYTERTLDLNLNVASMTGILWMMQEPTSSIWQRKFQRVRNYLENWSFRYGSSTLPRSSGIETRCNDANSYSSGVQGYNELVKALRCQKKATNFGDAGWNVDIAQSDQMVVLSPFLDAKWNNSWLNGAYGRFACGLNTQLTPDMSNAISGLNTNGITTQIHAKFNPLANKQIYPPQNPGVVNCLVNAWVEYDAFISIIPGIVTTVTF